MPTLLLNNILFKVSDYLYRVLSSGIMVFLIYITLTSNSTFDLQYDDKYFVVPTSLVIGLVVLVFGLHLYYIYKNYLKCNRLLLLIQAFAVAILIASVSYRFSRFYGLTRTFYSGITEDQMLIFQKAEYDLFINKILFLTLTIIICEVIFIIRINRNKLSCWKKLP